MKKILLLIVVLVLAGGAYYKFSFNGQSSENTMEKSETNKMEEPTKMDTKYTLVQVAEHGSKENCWLAIEGKVYDVSEYIKGGFHPGKAAILNGCGKDATEMFLNRANGSGSHSDKAKGMLQKFQIGILE